MHLDSMNVSPQLKPGIAPGPFRLQCECYSFTPSGLLRKICLLAVNQGIATKSKTVLFANVFFNKRVGKKNTASWFKNTECSLYRVRNRILHLAQQLQLMNEKTKCNVLDVMATPDVYCQ